MQTIRWDWRRFAKTLSVFALCVFSTTTASAFKVTTHVASANETLNQLNQVITPDPSDPNVLIFNVNGQTLNVQVTAKEAYLAVIQNEDYFRAGVVGPDGFPDLVTGQFWQHGNENEIAKSMVEEATGGAVVPNTHATTDPLESRVGASEMRSIDFAMSLLKFANEGDYIFASGERPKVIAFIMGYLAHGVGDSFAHTWVNQYAGGAWEFGSGSGVFGTFTEELKHVATEGLVDAQVPGRLQNADGSTGGEFDLMNLRAPIEFLDAFFSREIPNHQLHGDKNSSNYDAYLDYYTQLDRHYGAAVYSYFNMQVESAQAIKNFSEMGDLIDFADKWQPGPFVNVLFDIVDFPEQVVNEVEGWVGGDFIPFVTGGFLKCELTMGGATGLEAMRKVWDYLGGFNDRIERFEEKALIVRRNWLRLSECTAQNMVRIHGENFDLSDPTANRDACTVLADLPWADEAPAGDVVGLYRGSIRPTNEDDMEFLDDLRSYFRGSDDDGDGLLTPEEFLEPKNGHRKIGDNLARMRSYLLGFGFTLDDLEDVIITDNHESNFDEVCSLVRDPAEHHCLNAQLLPIALPVRQAQCLIDEAVCVGGKVADCLSGVCRTVACAALPPELCAGAFGIEVCIPLFGGTCEGLCDLTEIACNAAVSGTCSALAICDPLGILGCFNAVRNTCINLLDPVCEFIAGGDPSCVPGLFDCAVEGIVCTAEALELLFLQEGWAETILSPFMQVCDAYDQARQLFDRFDTLEERIAFAERRGVPVTRINEMKDLYTEVADKFSGFPPEYFVNVVYLREDLAEDPQYLADYVDALQDFEDANAGLAPGDEKEARDGAAEKLRSWADAAGGSSVGLPLVNSNLDPLSDEAEDDLREFGEISDSLVIPSVAGPTAKRILTDVGPDMPTTFNQFFNTVQGMKLIPLESQLDVEMLFTQEGVSTALLPWNAPAGTYSAQCTVEPLSLYCDVLISFDDPDCVGPDGGGCADLLPDPARNNWVAGRGLVVWNEDDGSGVVPENALTNFPLASTQDAYEKLYVKVFEVPRRLPPFFDFEDPTRPWTSGGPATVEPSTDHASKGGHSLAVQGCGYTPITSPSFGTGELGQVGTVLQVDVRLPQQQANPHWYGDMQLYVNIPAAGIWNQYIDQVPFTGKPTATWFTVEYALPGNVVDALLGDFPNATLVFAVNHQNCTDNALYIDNIRFAGELRRREEPHTQGGDQGDVTPSSLFGFESLSDWGVGQNATIASETVNVTQGSAALAIVDASGYGTVVSRAFSSDDAGTVGSKLSIDVFIPGPPPNPHWLGDLSASLTCPSLGQYGRWLGNVALTHLFVNEYNQLRLDMPADLVSLLNDHAFTDCSLTLALNVPNGAGTFFLDNLGFVE